MKMHSRSEQVGKIVAQAEEGAWAGIVYRVTSLTYPSPRAILSGEGSFRCGGRWNAPGSFCAVYGSTEDVVAVQESRATADYYGIDYPFVHPRLLVAIEFQLARVLIVENLGFSEELKLEDWRTIQARGKESLSQAIGREAFERGSEAMIAPSARVPGGINFVYFPERRRRRSVARVCEGDSLEKIEAKA